MSSCAHTDEVTASHTPCHTECSIAEPTFVDGAGEVGMGGGEGTITPRPMSGPRR